MNSVVSRSRTKLLSVALAVTLTLTACGGDEDEPPAAASPSGSNQPPPSGGAANRAPTITGTPAASTLLGRQYAFTPAASDPDGDVLTFAITGLPSWATFNSATGRLQGTPTQANVGTSSNIVISVTDGAATTNLPAFSIQVVATATGSAMLTWSPPTQNSDGGVLTPLASYRVYYGTSSGSYPNSLTIDNPGLSSFVVDQLTPATWYFVVTAVNANGVESAYSNVASKSVL
jgi:hypothetical protein